MATYEENLITARDLALARLMEFDAELRPSTSIDGESFQWRGVRKDLQDAVDKYNALLAAAGDQELELIVETPWE